MTARPPVRIEGRGAAAAAAFLRRLRGAVAVALAAYCCWYALARPMVRTRHANLVLGGGLVVFYLGRAVDGDGGESAAVRTVPLATAVAGVAATGYVEWQFDRLLFDAPVVGYSAVDAVVGAAVIALVTDATRRAYGRAIALTVVGAVAFALAGGVVPSLVGHAGLSPAAVARHGATGLSGAYGFILGVGATWVAIFVVFAGLARAYGAVDHVVALGGRLASRTGASVAQVAVVASMAMGSVTGSAAANTATTGAFTIPAMRDAGVSRTRAAAIESVASSGGQVLPPVMGVAAFLMADIVNVPYARVVGAALLPAALLYLGIAAAVRFAVADVTPPHDAAGVAGRPGGGTDYPTAVQFGVPFVVLVYALGVARYTPLGAGLAGIAALVAATVARDLAVRGSRALRDTACRTARGLRDGAVDLAPLLAVLSAMGVVVSMLTATGLTGRVTAWLAGAGGGLPAVLAVAAVASLLFGLGTPTPAAYLLVAVFVAPGVVAAGVDPLAAHLFVFYFALLSALTPPVAVAVAVAARIADAPFLRTAGEALRIAAPGFALPVTFVLVPSLLDWTLPATPAAVATVAVGILGVAYAASSGPTTGRRVAAVAASAVAVAVVGVV